MAALEIEFDLNVNPFIVYSSFVELQDIMRQNPIAEIIGNEEYGVVTSPFMYQKIITEKTRITLTIKN